MFANAGSECFLATVPVEIRRTSPTKAVILTEVFLKLDISVTPKIFRVFNRIFCFSQDQYQLRAPTPLVILSIGSCLLINSSLLALSGTKLRFAKVGSSCTVRSNFRLRYSQPTTSQ